MALYTKKLIMTAFAEMLEELPFDKITVAALVKRAGVSPNTFYYHYEDIYALLDAWWSSMPRQTLFWSGKAPLRLCCTGARTIRRLYITFSTACPGTGWSDISSP